MIVFIQGKLVEVSTSRAVVELNGLGYEVLMTPTAVDRLPPLGTSVRLQTLAIYREDSQTLYGFNTVEEREFFRLLIENVTGVGPKLALSIMSGLSLEGLQAAIRNGDIGLLAKCQGIGKKTAERLVVELRGKLGAPTTVASIPSNRGSAPQTASSTPQDAVLALMALGFKPTDADDAIRRAVLALGPKASTEALVKKALQRD